MRTLCAIALAAAAALLPAGARAASCTLSVRGVDFGAYDPLSAAVARGAGSVDYDCSAGRPIILRVTISAGSSGNAGARTMRSGAEQLAYNIYRDAALTTVWRDTNGTWQWLPPARGSIPMYGGMAAQQDVAAGAYTDALVVTFEFY